MNPMLNWALRTCLSTSVAVILSLTFPINDALSFGGSFPLGVAFVTFVCIVVADRTLGQTIKNGVAVTLGGFFSTFLCWITILVANAIIHNSPPAPTPSGWLLIVVFFLSFFLSTLNFYPIGKKMMLSLITLNLISDKIIDPLDCWRLYLIVIVGTFCAFFGVLLPYPRLASRDLEKKIQESAKGLSFLNESIIKAWIVALSPSQLYPSASSFSSSFSSISSFPSSSLFSSSPSSSSFASSTHPSNTSLSSPSSSASLSSPSFTMPLRFSISIQHSPPTFINIYYDNPPSRNRHWRLLCNVIWATILLRKNKKRCLWMSPKFQSNQEVSSCVRLEISRVMWEKLTNMQAMIQPAKFGPRSKHAVEGDFGACLLLVESLLMLFMNQETRLANLESSDLVKKYYKTFHSFARQPSFRYALFRWTKSCNDALMTISDWIRQVKDTNSLVCSLRALVDSQSLLNDTYYSARRVALDCNIKDEDTVRLEADFVLEINSFMFILDLISNQIYGFILQTRKTKSRKGRNFQWWMGVVHELFPLDQFRRLFARQRIKQALALSIAIVLSGLYGLFSGNTSQAPLAAFTVTYIGGADVAGASFVNSFGRATGTICASVLAIVVLQIISLRDMNSLSANIFIGIVVVAWQLPSTMIRSFFLYGYAGTVSGFSIALLLLAPELRGDKFITERIVDTFIGILIFLSIELIIALQLGEDLMLSTIQQAISRVEGHAVKFRSDFQSFQRHSNPRSRNVPYEGLTPTPDHSISSSIECTSYSSYIGLTLSEDIGRQRTLMELINNELPLFRPPLPRFLLDSIIKHQEEVHRALHILSLALKGAKAEGGDILSLIVDPSADQHQTTNLSSVIFRNLLPPVQDQLRRTYDIIRHRCEKMQKIIEMISIKERKVTVFPYNLYAFIEGMFRGRRVSLSAGLGDITSLSATVLDDVMHEGKNVYADLFDQFEEVVRQLLINHSVRSEIANNLEIKFTSSVINSTKDLIEALDRLQLSIKRIAVSREFKLR